MDRVPEGWGEGEGEGDILYREEKNIIEIELDILHIPGSSGDAEKGIEAESERKKAR